ncbi:hypothetical protein SRS16CHR_02016 [Variovorax sp. SRS16]|nr:hypothetical protein SRS16CHR_02016 [Variovorax sp. SRS16]
MDADPEREAEVLRRLMVRLGDTGSGRGAPGSDQLQILRRHAREDAVQLRR